MNKLEYIKKLHSMHLHLDLLSNMFANPISSAMQGIVFPSGHKKQLQAYIEQIHQLDNRIVTEPATSEHNAVYGPVWDMIKEKLLTPMEKIQKSFESKDMGSTKGFKSMYDYATKLEKIYTDFKQTGANITHLLGIDCTFCKDGKCTGGFVEKETKCDGTESCECFDTGLEGVEGWF